MNKINGSAKIKVSANKPATAHTLDRCAALKDRTIQQELSKLAKNESFANIYCIFAL